MSTPTQIVLSGGALLAILLGPALLEAARVTVFRSVLFRRWWTRRCDGLRCDDLIGWHSHHLSRFGRWVWLR